MLPNVEGFRDMAVSPPQNLFLFSSSKMARFGAFWVLFFSSAACFTRKITAEFDEGNGISASLADHTA